MDSFDVRGKAWILPCGRIVDCSTDEHARFARGVMLNLKEEDFSTAIPIESIFTPLTDDEVKFHRSRSKNPDEYVLAFLSCGKTVDPRVFAIQELGWIRTRENKFYAWQWTPELLERFANLKEFWKPHQQINEYSWLEFVDVKTGESNGQTYGWLCGNFSRHALEA